MSAEPTKSPVVHFVGSIPLPDTETVFRTLSTAPSGRISSACRTARPASARPGSGSCRTCWPTIRRSSSPTDVPPFKFVQWDGKVVREIPRLRVKPGATPDPATFKTGYADMAIESWGVFDRLQKAGVIPAGVKFQICIPTPIAPTYNNMVPADRPNLLPALTQLSSARSRRSPRRCRTIASRSNGTSARRCWPGRATTTQGPVDFRTETIDVLTRSATPCRPASSSAITSATAARPTSTWCSRRTPASWSR